MQLGERNIFIKPFVTWFIRLQLSIYVSHCKRNNKLFKYLAILYLLEFSFDRLFKVLYILFMHRTEMLSPFVRRYLCARELMYIVHGERYSNKIFDKSSLSSLRNRARTMKTEVVR